MAAVRPRRSAAQRASEAITDMADRDIYGSSEPTATMSSRARRGDSSGGRNSSVDPRKQQRKSGVSTSSASQRDRSESHDVVRSSRARPTRGPQKRYVESSDDEDAEGDDDDEGDDDEEEEEEDDDEEEEEEHDVIRVGDGMDVDAIGEDEDAEGEPDDMAMDVDADGEPDDMGGDEDAEGDLDMDVPTPVKPAPGAAAAAAAKAAKPAARATKAAKVPKSKTASTNKRRSTAGGGSSRKRGRVEDDEDDEEDEELSDAESVVEGEINASVEVVGEEDAEGDEDDEEDAEGDEDDEDDEKDAEGDDDDNDNEEDAEGDEDDEDREGTPDLSKMTRRQRARFEETPQEYMKLSDEVQVKKVFTAEELSMRRAEMARRRRNLSDKRNEEVKAETINKLLKRQAPKTTKKNALGDDDDEEGGSSTTTVFIRWTSNQQGSRVAVTDDLLAGPIGETVFGGPSARPRARKMVDEV